MLKYIRSTLGCNKTGVVTWMEYLFPLMRGYDEYK